MNTTQKTVATLAALALYVAGCAAPLSPDIHSLAREREQLYRFEDRDVTLIGRARAVDHERYHGSAVLLEDGTEVRVPELKRWPRAVRGGDVTIRGRLRRYTPGGAVGASPDEWFILEAVRWQKGDLGAKAR